MSVVRPKSLITACELLQKLLNDNEERLSAEVYGAMTDEELADLLEIRAVAYECRLSAAASARLRRELSDPRPHCKAS